MKTNARHSTIYNIAAALLAAIMLLGAIPLFAFPASAATNYPVWVNGIRFTSDNAASGIACGSGRATLTVGGQYGYKLTLNNATVSATDQYGIRSSASLEIVAKGRNTVSSTSQTTTSVAVYVEEDLCISGDGVLNLRSYSKTSSSYGIRADTARVDAAGGFVKINATGDNQSYWRCGINVEKLAVVKGTVVSAGSDVAVRFNNASASPKLSVSSPLKILGAGNEYGTGAQEISVQQLVNNYGSYKYAQFGILYSIWYNDIQITDAHRYEGIASGGGIVFLRDYGTMPELVLSNVKATKTYSSSDESKAFMLSEISGGISVCVLGECSIKVSGGKSCTAIKCPGATFRGSGKLSTSVTGTSTPRSICVNTMKMEMDPGGLVSAYAKSTDGTSAVGVSTFSLDIVSGALEASCASESSAPLFGLSDISIPEGVEIRLSANEQGTDPETVTVEELKEKMKTMPTGYKYAIIMHFYPVYAGKEQFTELNIASGIRCGSGFASLDVTDGEYTLTIDNITITRDNAFHFYSYGDVYYGILAQTPLTIAVKGTNKIDLPEGGDPRGVVCTKGVTFVGNGTLEINVKGTDNTIGIWTGLKERVTVNMPGGRIISNATSTGEVSTGGLNGSITVIRGTVTLTGSSRCGAVWAGNSYPPIKVEQHYHVFSSPNQNGYGATEVTDLAEFNRLIYHYSYQDEVDVRYVHIEQDECYNVVFENNGHGTAPESQLVLAGAQAVEPEAPTENGYAFRGWYTSPSCTSKYDFSTPVRSDITLYAKWARVYTVTFNANGHGTVPIGSLEIPDGETIWDHIDVFGDVAIPDVPGYEFYDYSLYPDNDPDEFFPFETPITGDITLYAIWIEKYIPGDLNNDGAVDDSDAVYLLYYTFFPEEYPLNQPCDFNNDGTVDDADAVYLLYHTFFPDEYPL